MPALYYIGFPENMPNSLKNEVIKKFDYYSWMTHSHLSVSNTFDGSLKLLGFEAFWPHSAEPKFPEFPDSCTITKR